MYYITNSVEFSLNFKKKTNSEYLNVWPLTYRLGVERTRISLVFLYAIFIILLCKWQLVCFDSTTCCSKSEQFFYEITMYRTPKRTILDGDNANILNVTPPNKLLKTKLADTGEKSTVNNGSSPNAGIVSPGETTRRGRPRAELLNALILEGATSPSNIKCTYCNRVFPREKSLQAHLRTHTGTYVNRVCVCVCVF